MKKLIHIHIGQLHASKEPAVIHTVLGSCVAVCLYDPEERIGGMNHILLPGQADLRHFDTAARYGINAMELLINRIAVLGGDRRRMIAKVFGGGHILSAISKKNGMGRKNAEFVFEFLQMEGIDLVSQDVGGSSSRKVLFHTDTGHAFLKTLPCDYAKIFLRKELKHWDRVRIMAEEPGEVTLFS
jgi:chemotaxis protein CheD